MKRKKRQFRSRIELLRQCSMYFTKFREVRLGQIFGIELAHTIISITRQFRPSTKETLKRRVPYASTEVGHNLCLQNPRYQVRAAYMEATRTPHHSVECSTPRRRTHTQNHQLKSAQEARSCSHKEWLLLASGWHGAVSRHARALDQARKRTRRLTGSVPIMP